MIASSFTDPVLGVDVHFEMVPMPAPVPTPIPNPFTGVVFDPVGLAAGLVIGAAVSAVLGAPIQGPVVYWTAFPATNTGTEAKHVPGHIIIPPGTAWAPFPKTPKPVIHPGETPKPALPVKPEDDAVVVFGSKTVTVMGSNAVRLGDIALSCSEPVRLPSSVVLAVPKGAPILIGGPPSLDILAAILASLRTRFISDSLHAALSRLKPSRFRNFMNRAVCFLTGHPVDVATGRVLTDALDFEYSGPQPLRIERVYSSAASARSSPLGHGWGLSVDQRVWTERGRVVQLTEDGRELEFDTFGLAQHRLSPGQSVHNRMTRSVVHCVGPSAFRIVEANGVQRHYAPVSGRRDRHSMIQRITSRCGNHETTFEYDASGNLSRVTDCGGRSVAFAHDNRGRVTDLMVPSADRTSWVRHRRYVYDRAGDLCEVTDARGNRWSYEYSTHLLVRETDRTGLSFFFLYDGLGEDAWCVRTWGDGGIYDHVLAYDKKQRKTFVTDSRGQLWQYTMNLLGQVVETVDPLGAKSTIEYSPDHLQVTKTVDPIGREATRTYDVRGNKVAETFADGTTMTIDYDERDLPRRIVDRRGGQWKCNYDRHRLLTASTGPTGATTSMAWTNGLLTEVRHPDGHRVRMSYGAHKLLEQYQEDDGADVRLRYDHLGRRVVTTERGHETVRMTYDAEGQVVAVWGADGVAQRAAYDAENNLIEYRDGVEHIAYAYGHLHRLETMTRGGTVVRYEYDTEDNPIAVDNGAGLRHRFELDEAGRLRAEHYVDGRHARYERDDAGRIVASIFPSQRAIRLAYDAGDRVVSVAHSDGHTTEFEYDDAGRLVAASNGECDVAYERDAVGRIVAETMGSDRVDSQFALRGDRTGLASSLGARIQIARDGAGVATGFELGGPSGAAAKFDVQRDAMGWGGSMTRDQSLAVQWTHDLAGRPTGRRTMAHAGTAWSRVDERYYAWTGQARLRSIADARRGTTTIAHDGLGQPIAERRPNVEIARALDRAGNVYRSKDGSDRRYGLYGELSYDGGDTFEHDLDGFVSSRTSADGRSWMYEWAGGLLRRVAGDDGTRVSFEYDPFARRSKKTVAQLSEDGVERVLEEVTYAWDGNHLLHERSSIRPMTTWFWHPDEFRIVAREHDGEVWTVVSDHLGTPTEMYDEAGTLKWQAELDLHGQPTMHVGDRADCPWRWPGAYEDAETGLVYLRHRYLTETGVFISPDPLGLFAGPRLYAYVADPLTEIDPLGLHTVYPKLNGQPVGNEALGGKPFFPNVHGSGGADEAASGLGRAGDSENLLLEQLERQHDAGDIDLRKGFLEIESLQQGRLSSLPPCEMCGDGLQRMADRFEMTIVYRMTKGKGGLRSVLREFVFRPNQPRVETTGHGCS